MPFDKDKESDTETQPGLDIDAASAEISSELFGQGDDEEVEIPDEVEGEQEAPSSPPGTVEEPPAPQQEEEQQPPENSEEVQAVGAPRTWSKEGLATWATIPERAQQEILKREEDYFRGIGMYKQSAELGARYSQVVEPYAALLAAEQIDPVQMFQSFAANHYLLSRGTPQQKLQIASNLMNHYGIPLQAMADFMGEQAIAEPPNPEILALRQELGELRGYLQNAANANQEQLAGQITDAVSAFDSAEHPYFSEVAEDMARLIETGLATSLEEAYDRAVHANPELRQKEIDRLVAEKIAASQTEEKTRKNKVSRLTAADVETRPHARSGTVPVGSMDDTLEETMASINARG